MPSRIPIGWLINPPRNQEERSKEREVAEKGKSKKSDALQRGTVCISFLLLWQIPEEKQLHGGGTDFAQHFQSFTVCCFSPEARQAT